MSTETASYSGIPEQLELFPGVFPPGAAQEVVLPTVSGVVNPREKELEFRIDCVRATLKSYDPETSTREQLQECCRRCLHAVTVENIMEIPTAPTRIIC